MILAAIDPGLSGAIAIFQDGELIDVHDMPHADKQILTPVLHATLTTHGQPDRVVIEKVQAHRVGGVVAQFKFGKTVGVAEGVCHAWPIDLITPQAWKKKAGLIGKDKDASRALAVRQWPHLADQFKRKKDDGRAEAALIGWTQLETL